jgi:hypothetical protein
MVRSMLRQAHIRCGILADAAMTATDMCNTFHKKCMGTKLEHLNTSHPFGEITFVEDNQFCGISVKLNNHGRPAMVLGVQPEHA